MKRYFFLGFGVGFILAGIFFSIATKLNNINVNKNVIIETKTNFITTDNQIQNNNINAIEQNKTSENNYFLDEPIFDEVEKDEKSIKQDELTFATPSSIESNNKINIAAILTPTAILSNEKSLDTELTEDNPTYHIQLRASKDIESCRDLMEKIEYLEEIKLKIIGTGGIYRLITVKNYEYLEALKLAEDFKKKYNITTYVKENQ